MRAGILGTLSVLGVWAAVTTSGLVDTIFLPTPLAVLRELRVVLSSGLFWADIRWTLQRTLSGYLVGAGLGVVVGFAMGYNRFVYQALEFPIDFFRSIPATALFPLFIVIFGLGTEVKIFVALWATTMVVAVNTIYGIRAVAPERLTVVRLKKTPLMKRFFLLMIPSALPFIFVGARVALSLALVVEVVAEMFLGGDRGLGRQIYNATTIFDMDNAYAGVVIIGLVGYALNKSVIWIEKRVLHWSG